MRPTASFALAFALVASTLAAACGPAPTPEQPTTEPPPSATPPGPPPVSSTPPASSSGATPVMPPPVAGGRAITPTQMTEKLAALGIDTKTLPAFDKLTPDQKRKVMPLFKQSLGFAECTGCHAEGDFKKITKNMKIAKGMWDHFSVQLKQDGGGLLFCDSCHGGSEHILDKKNAEAVRKFMHDEYVDKLDRADAKGHDCKTCHGDKLELDIFGKLWHAE